MSVRPVSGEYGVGVCGGVDVLVWLVVVGGEGGAEWFVSGDEVGECGGECGGVEGAGEVGGHGDVVGGVGFF